jgi:hypothetical protein
MNIGDILKMMGNPQALQAQAEEMRQRMAQIVVTGSAGGGMVAITLNGHMEMTNIQIAPECVDSKDIAMLTDLIRAAHSDAMSKARETLQSEMSSGFGPGMPGFGS